MKSMNSAYKLFGIAALCLASITSVVAQGTLDDALKAINDKRFSKAVEILTPLANSNNAYAQLRLGTLYYHGQGTAEDEKMAVHWWKKSAAQGNVEAMFEIANAYLYGNQAAKSVVDSDREAATWYFQAASAGHAEAQYHLGLLFLAGKGVISNQDEALRWFRKAADQGHTEAKRAMSDVSSKKKR